MALTKPVRAPRPSARRPWSLRDRLNERDIANLITAYRQGTTAASLATTHDLSLASVKRLLHTAGARRTSPTQRDTKATPTATHPPDAATRELLEETGVVAETVGIVGTYSDPRHITAYENGEVHQQRTICFAARVIGGAPTTTAEATSLGYFDEEQAAALTMHPTMRLRVGHTPRRWALHRMTRIFLSYSSDDGSAVDTVIRELDARGYRDVFAYDRVGSGILLAYVGDD